MAVKLLLVFTCFSLACCLVWAGPSKVIVRSEEGRWIAEVIGTSSDGWPEVVSRRSFATKEHALAQKLAWQQQPQMQIQEAVNFKPQVVKGAVWATTQSWSEEWEQKYAQWIENEVDTEFFVRYNVSTDCADVAYSLRWIFARIHGLPAAATLGGSNSLLTNETLRGNWASLPTATNWYQDRRFLAALNYLLDLTYTHTLWGDSFPVALNRKALLSGSYHLGLGSESGHTQVIHWLDSKSGIPFLTLNSTIPRKVRSLSDSMLFAGPAKDKKNAILRFRWAVKTSSGTMLKKAAEMPGYSLEQYSFAPQSDYTIALFEKLGYTGGKEGIREYLYKDLLAQFKMRVDLVKEAQSKCQNGACGPGTPEWEEWSTPSRDSRIKGKIGSLRAVSGPQEPAILDEVIVTIDGVPWSYRAMLYNWRFEEYSSDPQVSEGLRWGAGGASWAQAHLLNLQSKMRERQTVLQKGAQTCAGKNCHFGTELWRKTSSNEVDVALAQKIKYLTSHNGELPQEAMAIFESYKNTALVNVAGQNITLDHLLSSFASMNSSATASLERQWALESSWSTLSTNGWDIPIVVDEKWIVDPTHKGLAVWDIATGRKMDFLFKPHKVFRNHLLFVQDAQGYALYNLRTGALNLLPPDLQNVEVSKFVIFNDQLIVMKEDRLQVWVLDEAQLILSLQREVGASGWKAQMQDVFKYSEGLYDVSFAKTYPGLKDANCVGSQYFVTFSGGFSIVNRAQGTTGKVSVESPHYSGVDCESARFSAINERAGLTKVYKWNETFDLTEEFQARGKCYISNANLACDNGDVYLYQDNQWIKTDQIPSKYHVRALNPQSVELVERATGKVLLKGKRINVIQDRFAAVILASGDSVHVVDLKNPTLPALTNIFKSEWGAGSAAIGPYLFLQGWSENGGGTLLWRRPN